MSSSQTEATAPRGTGVHAWRQVWSLAGVARRLVADDPTHFFVQVSRRLPAAFRRGLAKLHPPAAFPSTFRAVIFTVADRRGEAVRALETGRGSTMANELRIVHGLRLMSGATATQRARQMWEVGDIAGALANAPAGSVLRRSLEAHSRILRKNSRLIAPGDSSQTAAHPMDEERGARPLRVIHQLTNSLPWTTSGYALRSHRILTALKAEGVHAEAMTRIGYPLDIGRISRGTVDEVDGVSYRRVLPARTPNLLDGRYQLQAEYLARQARAFRADVIHTTTPYSNALVAEAAARALGIPWVYEARGEMENTWLASRPAWAHAAAATSQRYLAMRSKEAEMAIRADAVVVLSNVQKDSLVERGVPAEKITVIGNAVDSKYLQRKLSPAQAREQLGLRPGHWVGTVSAIVDYEGLDTLVRAIGVLRDRGHDVNAAIVGDGVALPDLRDLARSLDLESLITFPGRVGPDAADMWYQALDVMTIPRRDTAVTRAVTPMKGLQAMALGIPQIVSDLPALVEIAARDGQGVAVTPEDAVALAEHIHRLTSDGGTHAEMSKRAREAARHHTWQHRAKQYAEIYEAVARA